MKYWKIATIDTIQESKRKESVDRLSSCLEVECSDTELEKSKLNQSLVEILNNFDLKAAQDEIQMGFHARNHNMDANSNITVLPNQNQNEEKAKQIAKIRAKIHNKKLKP